MTKDGKISDNPGSKGATVSLPPADPRILAFVRMLARKAAERDYARHVRRNGATHDKLMEEE